MKLIRLSKACVYFRLTDVQGCPYAVCLSEKSHKMSPDVVACQFSMSCSEYQRPGSNAGGVSSEQLPESKPRHPGVVGGPSGSRNGDRRV
jgi:hypothetical protein